MTRAEVKVDGNGADRDDKENIKNLAVPHINAMAWHIWLILIVPAVPAPLHVAVKTGYLSCQGYPSTCVASKKGKIED
jgi:hypothetical protein